MASRKQPNNRGRRDYFTVGARNLRNRCDAQLAHTLIDLGNALGRSPSIKEAATSMGPGFVDAVKVAYGSWNAAKAHVGLQLYKPGGHRKKIAREFLLECFAAWHHAHGTLPTLLEATRPNRTPLLPSAPTVKKILATSSWPEAMRRVAAILNIYGGRYGLPDKKETAA